MSTVKVTDSVSLILSAASFAPTFTVFAPSLAVKEVLLQSKEVLVAKLSSVYQQLAAPVIVVSKGIFVEV